MKAVDSAPSANRSRSRLGAWNAATKMSVFNPAPKKAEMTISRTNPSKRLHMMASPTTPRRPGAATVLGAHERWGVAGVKRRGRVRGLQAGHAGRLSEAQVRTQPTMRKRACPPHALSARAYVPFFLQLPLVPGFFPGVGS